MKYEVEGQKGFNLINALKYSSIAGWELGALLCAVFVPLQLWVIGETDISNFGDHALSLGTLGLWVFGFGLATFLAHGFALFCVGVKQEKLKLLVFFVYLAHFVFIVTVVVFAAVRRDVVDSYGQEMWNNAQTGTVDLVQKYFNCCGYTEKDKPKFPCNGEDTKNFCSDQIRYITLEGTPQVAVNTPLLLTFVILSILILYDIWMFVLVILWYRCSTNTDGSIDLELSTSEMNKSSIYTISRSNSTVSTCVTATTTDSTKGKYAPETGSLPSDQNTINGSSTSIHDGDGDDVTVKHGSCLSKTLKCFGNVGQLVSSSLQELFHWIGIKTAESPKIFITLSIVVGVTMTSGIIQQRRMGRGADLLLPEGSELRDNLETVGQVFPSWLRDNSMIIVHDGMLNTETIQAMAELDQKIITAQDDNGASYPKICFPLGNDECLRSNLFELWNFNRTITRHLTQEEVIAELNKSPLIYSPHTNIPFAINSVLGDVQYDSAGKISNSTAHLMRYFTPQPLDWELKFTEIGLQGFSGLDRIYVKSAQSEDIEFDKTFYSDVPLLMIGGFLIFLYVLFMAGNWSLVGHRFWIAVASIVSIGLSLGLTIGLSAALLYPWTQLGLLAPFLLLGVGVDDMFVILRTWDNVVSRSENRNKSITEKAGLVLRLAGASITVTSMTDLVAFCIGISSTIPFLSSFCVTLSIGVVTLFIMQVTFFFPALILDERRKLKKHDGFLLGCHPHPEDYKENKYADMQLQKKFFKNILSYIATNKVAKVVILLSTLGMAGVMAYGVTRLNYNYDEDWFIDQESYLSDYYTASKQYFKDDEMMTSINIVGGDFYTNRLAMDEIKKQIEANEYIVDNSCYGWFDEFKADSYRKGVDYRNDSSYSNSSFNYYQSVIAFVRDTPIFAKDLQFDLSGTITASRFVCKGVAVDLQSDALPGMQSLRDLCYTLEWENGEVFPISEDYVSLESILIVKSEIVMNLALTFAAVTVIILFLISSLQTCFWVIISVFLTILDVGGVMYYWGLTIEAGTMVCLILAIGLAVDYSSHVGYKFMVFTGDRNQRAKAALINIGPAVFNGGFSTFLPIIMLAGSNIYVTMTFYKVFVSVVVFGLWHSLIFLPVILSLVGPAPYKSANMHT